jgi:hypothetical protein
LNRRPQPAWAEDEPFQLLANKLRASSFQWLLDLPAPQSAEIQTVLEQWLPTADDRLDWWKKLAARTQNNPAWQTAIEQWLIRNLNLPSRPLWLDDAHFSWFDETQRAESLQRLFERRTRNDQEIQAVFESDGFKLNDATALRTLLRVDLEMRLKGDEATERDRALWDGSIKSVEMSEPAASQDEMLESFLTFLTCQKLSPQSSRPDLAAARDKLIALLAREEPPAWLNPERLERLQTPLGFVALNELGKTDRDLLSIDQFQLDKQKKFKHLLDLANAYDLHSPALSAARSMLLASLALETKSTRTADWEAIALEADSGYNDLATNELLVAQQSRMLLFYVLHRAKLRTAPAGSDDLKRAISAFKRMLEFKPDKSDAYFDFAETGKPQDAAVYRLLVQPVLEHPAVVQADTANSKLDPAAIALAWGVRGKLLQRSPAVAALVESPAAEKNLTPTTQLLLLQHRAFQQAHKFDDRAREKTSAPPDPHYVAGSKQVLAAIPKQDDQLPPADLIAIVNTFDPAGSSDDVELLRLGAHFHRQQAIQERNPAKRKQAAQQALARYTRLFTLAAANDARNHRAIAAESLSDLHLNLSQWAELGPADFAFAAGQTSSPPNGSKSYHLQQAGHQARQAIAITNRPNKENAFLALASAQEQLAFSLGLINQYQEAIQTLDQGVSEASAAGRSTSRLQALKGRCWLRQAQELFAGLSSDERTERLQWAVTALDAALGERQETKRFEPADAESLLNLAESHLMFVQERPEQRTQRLALAETALRHALEAVDKNSPRIGHYRWRLLVVLSHQGVGTSSDPSRVAQKFADETYDDALKNLPNYDPVAMFGIATQTGWLYYYQPSKMQRWLPPSGPLHAHWRSSDAGRLEAARLYCEAAVANPTDPSLRSAARQLAGELGSGSLQQRLAWAWLKDCAARQSCSDFEKYKPTPNAIANANQGQQNAEQTNRQAAAAVATAAIRDAFDLHVNALDDHIRPLVDQLHRASLDDIKANKVLPGLTVLEKRALWKFASTAPALETRQKFCEICSGTQSLGTNDPATAQRPELSKLSQDLLKPALFFADLKDREPRLKEVLKLYKPPAAESDKPKTKTSASK